MRSPRSARRCAASPRSTRRGCAGTTEARSATVHVAIVGNSAAALSALESFRGVTARRRSRSSATSRPAVLARAPAVLPAREALVRGPRSSGRRATTRAWTPRPSSARASSGSTLRGARARARRRARAWPSTGCCSPPGRARRPPIPGLDGPGVHHLWTLDDAVRLDPLLRRARVLVVLGSGFVALQAAWAARQRGARGHRGRARGADPAARARRGGGAHPAASTSRGARRGRRDRHAHRRASRRSCGERCCVSPPARDVFAVDAVIVATGARPNDELLPEAVSSAGARAPGGRDHGDGGGRRVRRRRRDPGLRLRRRAARDPRPLADGRRAGPRGRRQPGRRRAGRTAAA